MNKKIFLLVIISMVILLFEVKNVYADTLSNKEYQYSYTAEYEKYIGVYYRMSSNIPDPTQKFDNTTLYNDFFKLDTTVKKSDLDKWINPSSSSYGGLFKYEAYSLEKLEAFYQSSLNYRTLSCAEIQKRTINKLFLHKGIMRITDDDTGDVLATIPNYLVCERTADKAIAGGPLLQEYKIKIPTSKTDISSKIAEIYKAVNTFDKENGTTIGNGDKVLQAVKKYEYSYSEEYKKYIGVYTRYSATTGDPNAIKFDKQSLFNDFFKLETTVKKNDLDKWIKPSQDANGCLVKNTSYKIDELEHLYQESCKYRDKTCQEIEAVSSQKLFLDKGIMTIVGDSGEVLAKIPHYLVCERTGDANGKKYYTVNINTSSSILNSSLNQITNIALNFQRGNSSSSSDFWGDASSWFWLAKSSGYETPDQVENIISVFEDMINVVGTTIIIVATIVLGIKYIIGTVDSKTSAKEGLITLLVACVFFFGWTSIKNLLFPDNNFIFTEATDTSYTNMVGRMFSTFTYIAQFIVVGAIIFVGIKYIFAGADGRAELKSKSVYFIIGIILVFATTNVLSFVSDIINETIGS